MSAEVISLHRVEGASPMGLYDRLGEIAGLLQAINAGELLAAFPDCPVAYEHHRLALTLLSMAELQIASICADLAALAPF